MTIGRCLCGAVSYEIVGPFQALVHCHCSMCRKHHGTGFATFATSGPDSLRWVSGEDLIATHASSPRSLRSYCSLCGSVVPTLLPGGSMVITPAGNLDSGFESVPQIHIFAGSKARWDSITDEHPRYAEYPPGFAVPALQDLNRPAPTGCASGSCLCGDVTYRIAGAPLRMTHCHCSRCRRGRSAAYATNVIYRDDGFEWLTGASQVKEFKVPDARYFTVAFCGRCGGELPRVSTDRGIVVVPAGSLDSDPGVEPQMHIFTGSRASWVNIADSLPRHIEGLPA